MTHQTKGRIGRSRYPQLLQMIAERMTANEIAARLGVDPETVRKFARRRNLEIHSIGQRGENHPSWTGGHTLDRSGYLLRRVPLDGPHGYLIRAIAKRGKAGTDPNGYAPVHRIVAHETLGRALLPGEVVDHIDGNIANNSPENLRVFASNGEHLRETLRGRRPNWSAEGFERMRHGRPRAASRPGPTPLHPRNDDPA